MSINLNDDSFDAKEGVAIFNEGTAGISENVTLTIEKRKKDDKDAAPEYKIVFTDEAGATCNVAFWHITKDTQYDSIDEQIAKKGKVFKHLLRAMYGADYQIPNFKDKEEMLTVTMKLLHEGSANSGKFRIFANYGTTSSTKEYIQPRSWVPFIEPMTVDLENTRLVKGSWDAMERLQKDTPVPAGAAADDGDDW